MPLKIEKVVVEDLMEDAKAALIFIDQTVKNHPDKRLAPLVEEALSVLVDAITASISTLHLINHVNKHSLAEAQADYLACIQQNPED